MDSEVLRNGIMSNFLSEINAQLEQLLSNYSAFNKNLVVYMSVPAVNYLLAFCDLVLRGYASLFRSCGPLASHFSSSSLPQAYIQHSLALGATIVTFVLVLLSIVIVRQHFTSSPKMTTLDKDNSSETSSCEASAAENSSNERRRSSKILTCQDRVLNQSVKSFAAAKAMTLMNNEAAVQGSRTPQNHRGNSAVDPVSSPAASHASVASRLFAASDFETQSATSQNTDDSHSLVGMHFTPSNILSYALKNPKVLTGWRVDVAGHGKGIVLGIEKAKFFATRFKILFDDGSVKSLRLKRGPSKGNVPFTLLDSANNSNHAALATNNK